MIRALTPDQAPLTTRSFFANGQPGPLTATMAHVPELLNTAMPFVGAALGPAALGFREKELIILRTSVLQQCAYCVGTHSVVALKAKLSDAEIEGLRKREVPEGLFSEREQVLLRWVDQLAETAGALTDAAREELAAHFEEHEIVDLLLCCGATVMLNRYSTALQLPLAPAHIELLAEKGWL